MQSVSMDGRRDIARTSAVAHVCLPSLAARTAILKARFSVEVSGFARQDLSEFVRDMLRAQRVKAGKVIDGIVPGASPHLPPVRHGLLVSGPR